MKSFFSAFRTNRTTQSRRSSRQRAQRPFEIERLEQRSLLSAVTPVAIQHAFTVTNTRGDASAIGVVGSLAWAINQVNHDKGTDTINFKITNSLGQALSKPTINLTSPLPAITRPVVIDGTTQLGGRVEVNGANVVPPATVSNPVQPYATAVADGKPAVDGLVILGGNSTVRGLVIDAFSGDGLVLAGKGGDTIQGNYLGTDKTGTTAPTVQVAGPFGSSETFFRQQEGLLIYNVGNNVIGGLTAAQRNVLSGNLYDGIAIMGALATNNVVESNFIGIDYTGKHGIANDRAGVFVQGDTSHNTIGGTNANARNFISYNGIGVSVAGTGNVVEGNYIGTDVTGEHALGNAEFGVSAGGANTIGGTTAGAGNVISGNGTGIGLGSNVLVEGNYIGLDSLGKVALANPLSGIVIDGSNNIIGGTSAGARNVISGNGNANVLFEGMATANFLQGNYIGTNASGRATLSNEFDVYLQENASGNFIGGAAPNAGNLIDSSGVGITITDAATNNQIQGNWIGTNVYGDNLRNGYGLQVFADGNLVGGTVAGAGNTIAFNLKGVSIALGVNNSMLGNSIYSNTVIGIDLGDDGPTANDDQDPDLGANNFQNFPVLSSAKLRNNGTKIEIKGSLNSVRNTSYRIELFSTPASDALGDGEGKIFLGFVTVKTNGNGNANFDVTLNVAVPAGSSISATATELDDDGNPLSSSEFSKSVPAN